MITGSEQRATSGKNTWRSVFRIILAERKRFWMVVLFAMLSSAAYLVEPLIYKEAVNDVSGLFVARAVQETHDRFNSKYDLDEVDRTPEPITRKPHTQGHVARRTTKQALETLLWAVLILFGVNMIGHFFWYLGDNLNVHMSCAVERRYLEGTFGHVLRLPLRFFGTRSSSAVVKRIDQTEHLSEIMNGFAQQILPELMSLIGILAIMLTQSVTLTLLSLSVVPVYLWLAWRSSQRLELGLDAYYEKWEVVTARMQDAVAGIKTVKLSGAEQREVDRLSATADQAYGNFISRALLTNRYLFWETALTYVVTALVLGYGGYLALMNQLTPGDVVMFVAFIDRLYDPLDTLSTLWVDMQQNAAAISRADRLLNSDVEEMRGMPFTVSKGRVEFRRIDFGYKHEHQVLHDLSFIIEPGNKTAIVGHSGAGKTTTVDLLLKLFEPWAGEILVDGVPLSTADPSDVRRHIGMVMADGMVFRGTLAENMKYGRPDATPDEVRQAAIAAGLGHTLERLPDGMETEVGEGGIGLSVGERQRIQIARVLLAKPRILVLDEATANLDYATEQEVQRTVDGIRKENTVIVIAHRYSMVKDADQVIVLDGGRISEQGTPEELIAAGGWFADFSRAQDEDGAEEAEPDEDGEEADAGSSIDEPDEETEEKDVDEDPGT